jgi:hypothetical protein
VCGGTGAVVGAFVGGKTMHAIYTSTVNFFKHF